MATLTTGGDVRIWAAETGEPITAPMSHPSPNGLGRLGFSRDGRRLLIATGDDAALLREFIPDSSSISELLLKANTLSARKVDIAAGMVPLDPLTLSNAWHQLHASGEGR